MKLVIEAAATVCGDAPDERRAQRLDSLPAVERFSDRQLRRVSHLGRLALLAVDPIWAQCAPHRDELGLVVGTGLADLGETVAFLDGIRERGRRFASPQHFQRSVHGAVAGELAILYGLRGFNLTVTEGLRSSEAALRAAGLALAAGRCARCLCVAVDSVPDALLDGRDALGSDATLAEGAAALLLALPGQGGGIGSLETDALPWAESNGAQSNGAQSNGSGEPGVSGASGLIRIARHLAGGAV